MPSTQIVSDLTPSQWLAGAGTVLLSACAAGPWRLRPQQG